MAITGPRQTNTVEKSIIAKISINRLLIPAKGGVRGSMNLTSLPSKCLIKMLNPRKAGVYTPHSCHHCKAFVIYLYDEEGFARSDLPKWHRPNPSQNQLAQRVYGDIFWSREWYSHRLDFFSGSSGVSFFGLFLHELDSLSRNGCLLARRFIQCLPDNKELGDNHAAGIRFQNPYSVKLGTFDLKRLRWKYLTSSDDVPGLENWYILLAEKGSHCRLWVEWRLKSNILFLGNSVSDVIKNRFPNPDPSDATALSHAKGWMEECLRNHDKCKKPRANFKPTRLIQISRTGSTTMCRLRDMSSMTTEPYAALSYCWGGNQPFKTTTATLPQNLEGIELERLPRTLQDAVFVTQQLGLRFLWIDALCIVQDSTEDKTCEIGMMAKIYSNATITIAASRAKTVWEGFLHERPVLGADRPENVFSLSCYRAGQDLGPVTLVPIKYEKIDPLDTRGWTFQERVLSSRIIGFGTLRSHFTCETSLAELPSDGWSNAPLEHTFGNGVDSKRMADLIAGKYSMQEMLSRWLQVVEGFTTRGIGFIEDKLPAIAGLAERFGELTGDQYCAGLWRKGMPQSLMWYIRLPNANSRRPRARTSAPSWSWAAVENPVMFTPILLNGKGWSFNLEVEDCRVDIANRSSPYGAIKGGQLTINTLSRRAKCFSATGLNYYLQISDTEPGTTSESTIEISFFPDNVEKEFATGGPAEIDVHLLLFGTFVSSNHAINPPLLFGMVVRNSDSCSGKYSRTGLFQKTILQSRDFDKYTGVFHRGEKRSFVII